MTMTNQLDLFAARPTKRAADQYAESMVSALSVSGDWMSRERLSVLGLSPRACRAGREASHGRIIYGQRGYRATVSATMDEVRACINTLESQALRMYQEAGELRRVAHSMIAAKKQGGQPN